MDWQHSSLRHIMVGFFKERENLRGYNTAYIFDENERVKRDYHKIFTKCFVI
jgi:predicted amidohydrolase